MCTALYTCHFSKNTFHIRASGVIILLREKSWQNLKNCSMKLIPCQSHSPTATHHSSTHESGIKLP